MTSAEIKKAMVNFSPVVHRGIEYKYITAYIYRIYVNHHTGAIKESYELELLDKNKWSVVIVKADEVELLNTPEEETN